MSQTKNGGPPEYTERTSGRKIIRDDPNQSIGVGRYLATRIPTLIPPMDKVENPFTLLAMLSFKQWMFFLVAFFGWTWDAFDFFTVSLTVSDLAETFDKSTKDITWGITLVLM
jgi:MFS transporter, SHS family, lactate transporter